jgi:hypothetical protein
MELVDSLEVKAVVRAGTNGNPHLATDFVYRHCIAQAIRAAVTPILGGAVDLSDEMAVMYSEGWNHCCKALLDLADQVDFPLKPLSEENLDD